MAVVPHPVAVELLAVAAYTIPTDAPEGDGTLEWDSTTIVVVHARAGSRVGVGYTYGDKSVAELVRGKLKPVIEGEDAFGVTAIWEKMRGACRNLGRPGIVSMAISAVDIALWDLKAKLLELPLVRLLGQVQDGVALYGSGGFTSYPMERLCDQLRGWVDQGLRRVKMKVGSRPVEDVGRVQAVRDAIGPDTELFVDGNGAYSRKQALEKAVEFAAFGVRWFEEPVSSDDLAGLHLLRDRGPAGMEIAAGEYGYDAFYFRRMLEAEAVDVLQADITRCGGVTGFLRVAALCESWPLPLSAHTAAAAHLHPCAAVPPLRHLEYFHGHVRIERMLFDGVVRPREGKQHPDLSRPGIGLELKRADAERFAI